ncbi:hypothetical protein [Sulfurimonas sp. HSL3-7]|uniref:hypothetical protein n=1 Tax=Sulfonitrofixus jiaomeiensis TaxID=3131938 RepID=UPI0031F9F9AF
MRLFNQLFWLTVWGIAFAYIEASVVVYLRKIYYPEGFAFPVVIAETGMVIVEIIRELATLIIMWATVSLAYERLQSRMAAYMVLFGIWDIFYYIFLKLILNWPEGVGSWDLLFLIPMPWVGPVWAPVVVSLGLVYAGTAILLRNREDSFFHFSKRFIWLELMAGAVIILSFLIPGYAVIEQGIPDHFPYYLFWTGFIAGFGAFLNQLHHS